MKTLQHLTTALALAGLASAASAAGSLVIAPDSTQVMVGESFSVAVRGAGFDDQVVGGGFSLNFDPGQLQLDSVQVNTVVWEFVSDPGQIDNASGRLSDTYFNSFKVVLPSGDFDIARLNFTARGAGQGTLQLQASNDFPFANHLAEVIDVRFDSASVTVSAIPEPATWGTLAAGLALLGARRRRTPT